MKMRTSKKITIVITIVIAIFLCIALIQAFTLETNNLHDFVLVFLLCLFFDIGYAFHYITFPFYVVVVFKEMIYLSIILFFLLSISGFFVIKRFAAITKYSLSILIIMAALISAFSAYYEATHYIQKVATEKYNTQADVHINANSVIGAWINPAILGHNIYSPSHASIKIKGEWYHWSFDKKDFVRD